MLLACDEMGHNHPARFFRRRLPVTSHQLAKR